MIASYFAKKLRLVIIFESIFSVGESFHVEFFCKNTIEGDSSARDYFDLSNDSNGQIIIVNMRQAYRITFVDKKYNC